MDDIFEQLTANLNDLDLPEDVLDEIFDCLLNGILRPMCDESQMVVEGVKYWKQAFDELKTARTEPEHKIAIKNIYIKYFLINNEHCCTKFILIQNLSKAITHQIWSQLYEMRPKWHANPNDAISDILYSDYEIKRQLLFELIKDEPMFIKMTKR